MKGNDQVIKVAKIEAAIRELISPLKCYFVTV